MQSFIILGKNQENIQKEAEKLINSEKINELDIFTFTPEKAVGIADIRSINSKIFLKPLKGEKKAVVIETFLGMTPDSQNAFLKTLEEPPLSTIIILKAFENIFLPTILSRCKLITLDTKLIIEDKEQTELETVLDSIIKGEHDSLKLAQDLAKDKEQALNYLEKLIIVTREKMLLNPEKDRYKNLVKTLHKYYLILKKSNVNLRLALENMFLES